MADEFLLRLRTELSSNARQYGAELRRELEAIQRAAQQRGSARGVQQQLAGVQGRGLAAVESARRSGAFEGAPALYRQAVSRVADEVTEAKYRIARALSEAAGRPVKVAMPTEAQVRRSFGPAFRELEPTATARQATQAETRSLKAIAPHLNTADLANQIEDQALASRTKADADREAAEATRKATERQRRADDRAAAAKERAAAAAALPPVDPAVAERQRRQIAAANAESPEDRQARLTREAHAQQERQKAFEQDPDGATAKREAAAAEKRAAKAKADEAKAAAKAAADARRNYERENPLHDPGAFTAAQRRAIATQLRAAQRREAEAAAKRAAAAEAAAKQSYEAQNPELGPGNQTGAQRRAIQNRLQAAQRREAEAAAKRAAAAEAEARRAFERENPELGPGNQTGAQRRAVQNRLQAAQRREAEAAEARARRSFERDNPELGPGSFTAAERSAIATKLKSAKRREADAATKLADRTEADAKSRADRIGANPFEGVDPEDILRARAGLMSYRRRMDEGPGGIRDELTGIGGRFSALDREYGQRVGISDYRERIRREQERPEGERPSDLHALRRSLQEYQQRVEEAAEQQQLLNDLQGAGERDLRIVTEQLVRTRRDRQIVEARLAIEATKGLTGDEGNLALARRLRAAEVAGSAAGSATPADVETLAASKAAQADLTAATRARAAALRTDNEQSTRVEAESATARRGLVRAQHAQEQAIAEQNGVYREGTRFQRAQANIARRSGGPVRAPTEFQTAGQFAQSRFLTTAGFAASGALLYGGITAMKTLIQESTELQQSMAIIQTQFEGVDEAAAGITLEGFRQSILDTSKAAGVQANEVANVERQLAAAFSNDQGQPNFRRASTEGDVAVRFAKLTNLPQQEITDSLTAISLAFGDLPFEQVADRMIDLENRFGVLAPNLVTFTADLAPLGAQLGFTADQLTTLGAVAQLASGKSGAVLAEQFGRILPALQERASDLLELFGQTKATADAVPDLSKAFAAGDTPDVLRILVENYDRLTKAQQNNLASLVGSRREAGAFYALLDKGSLTVEGLTNAPDASGAFERRWDSYSKTITQAIDRMKRTAEEFGITLFESGIDDGLKMLITLGEQTATVAQSLLRIFGGLNDALGGLPGKILVAVAAWKAFQAIGGPVSAYGSRAIGGVRGFSPAGLTAPGGAFSPYTAASAGMLPGMGQLRPWTQRANDSRLLTRGLTRDLQGNVTAGFGTSTTSAIAGVAPIVGTVLIGLISAKTQEWSKEADEALKSMDDRVAQQIRSGVTRQDILAQADQATAGSTPAPNRIFGAVVGALTGPLGPGFVYEHGGDTVKAALDPNRYVREQSLDAVQKAEADKNLVQVRALRDRQLRTLAIPKGADLSSADLDKVVEQRKKLIEDYKKNPDDDNLERQVLALINAGKNDAIAAGDIARALAEFDRDTKAQERQLANAKQNEGFDTSTATAEARFALGITTVQPVIASMRRTVDGLEQQYKDAVELGQGVGAAAKALAEGRNALRERLLQVINDRFDFQNSIIELGPGGQAGDAAGLANAQARFSAIRTTAATSDADRANAAIEVIKAQREAFQTRVAEATTAAEKLALLDQGFEIDPQARRLILVYQLQQGPNAERVQQLAEGLGISLREAARVLVDNIDQFGKGNTEIAKEMLRTRIRQLEAAIRVRVQAGEDSSKQREALASARKALADLDVPFEGVVDPGATGEGEDKAAAQKAADAEARQQNIAIAQARAQIAKSRTTDPVKQAQIDLNLARELAKFIDPDDKSAPITAAANIAAGEQALSEAIRSRNEELVQARAALVQSLLAGDTVAQTRAAYLDASAAVGRARTEAERLNALAQQVSAQRAFQDAITDVFVAQQELAIAVANAAGSSVEVAERQLLIARRKLADGQRQGLKDAQLDRLRADVVNQQANLINTRRQDRIGDLDYLFEFDKITAGQYIALLTAELRKIPETNKEARREIERKIKGIRDELNQNLQFNLPDIQLPLLYEARRLGQTSALGQAYTDNRTVNLNVYPSDDVDVDRLVDRVASTIDSPPRMGPSTRTY